MVTDGNITSKLTAVRNIPYVSCYAFAAIFLFFYLSEYRPVMPQFQTVYYFLAKSRLINRRVQ